MIAIKSLTICIFSSFFPPVQSGSSTHCGDLSKELTKSGCKVIVITSRVDKNSSDFEINDGVYIYRLPALKLPRNPIALNFPWLNIFYFRSNTKRILEIFKNHPPDIVHLHNHMFDSAFHAVKIAKIIQKPLVITVHTIIKHKNFFFNTILEFIDRFILSFFIINQANVIICPDYIIKKYVVERLNGKTTKIIPYGIIPLRKPDKINIINIRNKYKIGDGPVILSLGHLHETRNRKELILALPKLLTQFPKLKIVIVGYIGTNSTIKLAIKLGVQNNVILTGLVPYSEIPDYFGLAQIEAHWFDEQHPHKTLGIAAQEAMSAGKVVIGNAIESIYGEGVLQNGINVVLVNPRDTNEIIIKISELLNNLDKRIFIEKNASQTAQSNFDWQVVSQKIIDTYYQAQINYQETSKFNIK